MTPHQRLIEILLEKSVRFGSFTLASGKQTDFYVDVRQTSLFAEGAAVIGGLILERLRPEVVADPAGETAFAETPLETRPYHFGGRAWFMPLASLWWNNAVDWSERRAAVRDVAR